MFSQFCPASFEYLFINLLFQPILLQFLSSQLHTNSLSLIHTYMIVRTHPHIHYSAPSYFQPFFLREGACILFYTPSWLHLHQSGKKYGGSAGCMLHSWILVSVLAGRQAGRQAASWLLMSHPTQRSLFQQKEVSRDSLMFMCVCVKSLIRSDRDSHGGSWTLWDSHEG